MQKQVTILTEDPTVIPIAEMQLNPLGIEEMMEWVATHRPECLPEDTSNWQALFPHDLTDKGRPLTANELLVELCGRKCYDSFGLKAGKKENAEYIKNTQESDPPHASIMYSAKMTFFFAGISRRVSHELIRNYVGADRDFEGSPSQESTRFTHHYGFFIAPPRYLTSGESCSSTEIQGRNMLDFFANAMQRSYDKYLEAVDRECAMYEGDNGKPPTGMAKKRIYEAASSFLPHQAETSLMWTTNPIAAAKFFKERENPAADLEMQRFAKTWRKVCVERWPNLWPQSWMHK
jgi:thymidylate synthase ThyX